MRTSGNHALMPGSMKPVCRKWPIVAGSALRSRSSRLLEICSGRTLSSYMRQNHLLYRCQPVSGKIRLDRKWKFVSVESLREGLPDKVRSNIHASLVYGRFRCKLFLRCVNFVLAWMDRKIFACKLLNLRLAWIVCLGCRVDMAVFRRECCRHSVGAFCHV